MQRQSRIVQATKERLLWIAEFAAMAAVLVWLLVLILIGRDVLPDDESEW